MMRHSTVWSRDRWLAGLWLMFAALPIATAQTPSGELPRTEIDGALESIELTPAPRPVANPARTEQKIRAALDGAVPNADADPILDEVLQIIRQRGSVLQGSTLDPQAATDTLNPQLRTTTDSAANQADERALAAEMLLRTARRLNKLATSDSTLRELVIQMRREAAKLLAE